LATDIAPFVQAQQTVQGAYEAFEKSTLLVPFKATVPQIGISGYSWGKVSWDISNDVDWSNPCFGDYFDDRYHKPPYCPQAGTCAKFCGMR